MAKKSEIEKRGEATVIGAFDELATFEILDSQLFELVASDGRVIEVAGGFLDGACGEVNGVCNTDGICGNNACFNNTCPHVNAACPEEINTVC